MIDHLELSTSSLADATRFYRAALAPLGYALHVEGNPTGFGADRAQLDFWLRAGEAATPRPHFAFFCATRALVERAHRAALVAGGVDTGAPALRADIHPTYFAAFVRDPDGHNVEFVCQT